MDASKMCLTGSYREELLVAIGDKTNCKGFDSFIKNVLRRL